MKSRIKCPNCQGEAVNKYGKTASGKQRYICLVCRRQFIETPSGKENETRPTCPLCGKKMYIYRTETDIMRYRCSNYPKCRGFAKIERKGD